uniref:Putative ATPase domain containing protein n=1 Tax=viral metagenome TaxID=1070528 RepID=A0A6M3L7J2_9ZZZZ
MREGYWLWDEETSNYTLVPFDELDPDILQRLRSKPAIGGFCYAAEDFLHLPLTSAPFYVANGWLPRQGKSIIFAPDKTGKSFLALQLARCIAQGEPFIGMETTQGRVLYVQFELGMETLQSRMRSTGQDYEEVFVGTSFSMNLDETGGQKQLWLALEAIKPRVLILDPLYKAIVGDENLGQDIKKVIDFLDDVIEAFECSVVVIDHTGKDIGRGARGWSGKAGWVDSLISMKRVSKKGERLRVQIMPVSMRHAELPPEPMIAQLGEDFEFYPWEADKPLTIKDKILDLLKSCPQGVLAAADIHAAQVGARSPVNRALKELVKEGKLQQPMRGAYEKGGIV